MWGKVAGIALVEGERAWLGAGEEVRLLCAGETTASLPCRALASCLASCPLWFLFGTMSDGLIILSRLLCEGVSAAGSLATIAGCLPFETSTRDGEGELVSATVCVVLSDDALRKGGGAVVGVVVETEDRSGARLFELASAGLTVAWALYVREKVAAGF